MPAELRMPQLRRREIADFPDPFCQIVHTIHLQSSNNELIFQLAALRSPKEMLNKSALA